jgi:hypothetical protein
MTASQAEIVMQPITKVTNQKDCKPGHLYCAVVERESFNDEAIYDRPTYDSFEGLYWAGADGQLYAVANAVGEEDDEEPSYPDYDYLVEQVGSVNASYAK